jgi:hypothetical protein
MSFNKELFLENTRNIHLSVPDEIGTYDAIQDENVRERLETFIDYDGNSRLSTALGELCANVVGRTMFKILIAKKPPGMRVKIIDIGPGQTRSRNPLVEQKGSSYLDYEVRINLNLYDRYGIGIPSRQYYCLNEDDITIKRKSIAGSLFHEFTHCLHETEDAKRYNSYGVGSLH